MDSALSDYATNAEAANALLVAFFDGRDEMIGLGIPPERLPLPAALLSFADGYAAARRPHEPPADEGGAAPGEPAAKPVRERRETRDVLNGAILAELAAGTRTRVLDVRKALDAKGILPLSDTSTVSERLGKLTGDKLTVKVEAGTYVITKKGLAALRAAKGTPADEGSADEEKE